MHTNPRSVAGRRIFFMINIPAMWFHGSWYFRGNANNLRWQSKLTCRIPPPAILNSARAFTSLANEFKGFVYVLTLSTPYSAAFSAILWCVPKNLFYESTIPTRRFLHVVFTSLTRTCFFFSENRVQSACNQNVHAYFRRTKSANAPSEMIL